MAEEANDHLGSNSIAMTTRSKARDTLMSPTAAAAAEANDDDNDTAAATAMAGTTASANNHNAIAKTPPRHSYSANPNHTPIASIKRTRVSMERQNSNNASLRRQSSSGASTPLPPTAESETDDSNNENLLSPMHPPKACQRHDEVPEEDSSWVGRKVDALFSPMLSLLSAHDKHHDHDGDVKMDQPTAISSESSSSPKTTATNTEEDDEDDDEVPGGDDDGSLQPVQDTDIHEEDFNPWQFIKCLPSYSQVAHQCPPVTLPAKTSAAPRLTLVLDLDETLVHCTVEPIASPDLTFPVMFHGMTYTVHVRLRPFLPAFLRKLAGQFEVIVFTASQKVYAQELLNRIDEDGKLIQHRLFRESCLAVEGNFLKDLNVLGRDLAHTILVDNSPHAFGYQVDNGIPIESWFDDSNDRELLKLERFLRTLQDAPDVRPLIRQKFQCHKLIAKAQPYHHAQLL